jgi:hypothetical protein
MNSNEEEERGCPGGAVGNPEVPLDDIPGRGVALDALLSRGAGMSLGGLKNYAAAHGEELDAAAFISSGAVFRVGELVFPVGCKRVGHREFEMPQRSAEP